MASEQPFLMNGELKLIRWHDSRGVSANWQILDHIKNDGICQMQSVGWITTDTEKHICIVPHIGIEDDGEHQGCGEMHIPKSCIDQIVSLHNSTVPTEITLPALGAAVAELQNSDQFTRTKRGTKLNYVNCPTCDGTGKRLAPLGTMHVDCKDCAGFGIMPEHEAVKIAARPSVEAQDADVN